MGSSVIGESIAVNNKLQTDLFRKLRVFGRVVVLTGSGVSAESGIPTFREAQSGLWARYDPQELATPQAFKRNPKLVWEWYTWRREMVSTAQPNPAHYALAELESILLSSSKTFALITQNVDGLHQRAGSRNVIEIHGNLMRTKCSRDGRIITNWPETGDLPPRCPDCSEYLRPDVVWFGENLSPQALSNAYRAAQDCDAFFSIGTSSLIEPAASLAYIAQNNHAIIIEINPNRTPLTSSADVVFPYPAGEFLPNFVQTTWMATE